MNQPGPDRGPPLRWLGLASVAYGVASVAVGLAVAVVIRFTVSDAEELLADVAARRALWLWAAALLIAQQALLVPIALALAVTLAHRVRLLTLAGCAFLALAGLAYIASGVCHGVLGAHLVAAYENPLTDRSVTVAQATVVHALGDTNFAVALVSGAVALVVLAGAVRRSPNFPPRLATLALAASFFQALQFGWFVFADLGAAAPIGGLLQGAWFVWLGAHLGHLARVPAIS